MAPKKGKKPGSDDASGQGKTPSDADAGGRGWTALQAWLEESGGKSTGVKLQASGEDISVVATAALRAQQEVCSIPRALWVTPGLLHGHGVGRTALEWAEAEAHRKGSVLSEEHLEICLLAVLLLLERAAPAHPELAGYLASLPWSEGIAKDLPLTWPPERLAAQLQGAAPQEGIEDKRRELAAVYASLQACCAKKGKEVKAAFAAACKDAASFVHAFALVHSRTMNIPSSDAKGGSWQLALIPFADMFNHSSSPDVEFYVETKPSLRYVFCAMRNVPEGAAVNTCYRLTSNAQAFFATYGFAEGRAEPQELRLPWEASDSEDAVLRFSSPASFRRLLSRLRVAAATAEERAGLDRKAHPSDAARLPISARCERAALEKLRDHLAARASHQDAAEAPEAPSPAAAAMRAADTEGWARLDALVARGLEACCAGEGPSGPRLAVTMHRAVRAACTGAEGEGVVSQLSAGAMEIKEDADTGRGYYAAGRLEPGTVLLVEAPDIFDAEDDDFGAGVAAAALGMELDIQLRVAPGDEDSDRSREAKEAAKWLQGMKGVSAAEAARAYVAAKNNGFRTSMPDAPEREPMLLFRKLSIFNHSCLPNCTVHRDDATGVATVLVIRPVAAKEELTTHYSDELILLPTDVRRNFIRGRFGFDCRCGRCDGSDHAGAMIEVALGLTAEPFSPPEVAAKLHEMRRAHASVCRMLMQDKAPAGFAFREFDDWESALAAVDAALPSIAAYGGLTFWARHHARELRCMALEGLKKDAIALMALAEHIEASWKVLPPYCKALLTLQGRFEAVRSRLPPMLRLRLEERARELHGKGLQGLEADMATLRRWLGAEESPADVE